MAIGGPAGFGAGFIEGFSRSRQHAKSRVTQQLNEALRLQKEDRESKEAIAKEGLAYERAKAEASLAQSELALVEQRRSQVMAEPGKPFRDSALEGHLEAAKERMADAHAELQDRQGKLQDLIEDRDARVRGAIQPTKTGGFLGMGQSEVPPEKRTPEQVAAYKAEVVKGEREQGAEFNKAVTPVEREIRQAQASESRERGNVGGAEKALEVGRAEQGPVNEEARNTKLFPLDEQSAKLRAKQLESQSAMAAAAQEIQARQQQQQQLQATPGYANAMRGGAATGKGGGGGGGLLGSITGKGGGSGSPAPQGQPAAGATPPGGVPTVGQAISPILGKVAQMPVNQVAQAARQLLGGAMGGASLPRPGGAPLPPQRPDLGQQQSFSGPRQPQRVPPPSVAMQGQGGGLFPELVKAYQGHGWSPQEAINIASVQTRGEGGKLGSGGMDSATGGSNGISQWSADRWARGVNWMKANGYNPRSAEGQAAWTTQELRSTYKNANPNSVVSLVNDYESPRKDLRAGEIARSQRAASSAGAGGPVQSGNYKGQDYTYQTQPALSSNLHTQTNQEQGVGKETSTQGMKQKQGSQAPQAPPVPGLDAQNEPPPPPIDVKPFAGNPQNMHQPPQNMQQPTQNMQQTPESMRADNMNQGVQAGVPMIHSPDQLKGMKPGSLFRAPDGRLKIVPLIEAQQ
jgi:hypothetical protein